MSARWFQRGEPERSVERRVDFVAHNPPGSGCPPEVAVPALLSWDLADPLVIRARFSGCPEPWRIDRTLIARGLRLDRDPAVAGGVSPWTVGDVAAWVGSGLDGEVFWLRLSTRGGTARLTCPPEAVEDFYVRTVVICPPCAASLPALGLLPGKCKDLECQECAIVAGLTEDADRWRWEAA